MTDGDHGTAASGLSPGATPQAEQLADKDTGSKSSTPGRTPPKGQAPATRSGAIPHPKDNTT